MHVLNGYGQAEIGEVIGWTAADAKAHPEKVGAVGKPHPGVDIRIDADDHLLVRPPNTAAGIDERVDAEGFIDTGDLARIDEDGFVWIEGRASDLINRGGNKVYPESVEEVLRLAAGGRGRERGGRARRAAGRGAGGVPRRSTRSGRPPDRHVPRAPRGLQDPGRLPLGARAAEDRGGQGAARRARALARDLSPGLT